MAFQTSWLPTRVRNSKAMNIHALPENRVLPCTNHHRATTGEMERLSVPSENKVPWGPLFGPPRLQKLTLARIQLLNSTSADIKMTSDIILTPQRQLISQTVSPSLVHEKIAERRERSRAQYKTKASVPLIQFSAKEWNPVLRLSTNHGSMRTSLRDLHHGPAIWTQQWDQSGEITSKSGRGRSNLLTNVEEEVIIASFPEGESEAKETG